MIKPDWGILSGTLQGAELWAVTRSMAWGLNLRLRGHIRLAKIACRADEADRIRAYGSGAANTVCFRYCPPA